MSSNESSIGGRPRGEAALAEQRGVGAGGCTRRQFLGTAAKAGALVAAPYFVPASALGRDGRTAPSERIVMGGIGIGRRGQHDLSWAMSEPDVQFVAICDCDREMREKAKAMVDQKYGTRDCKTYIDMREFLPARPDIDAVLIATSERWHALASIYAMRAGKDVYCEKPGSMNIAEGRALLDTANRYGRVFQTGTQRRSEVPFIFATQLARTGGLGKLHTVFAHTLPDVTRHDWLPAEPEPPKEQFDWDLWLGPTPWRPFNRRYIHGWYGHYDWHTGGIGEWGSHTINQCQMAAGVDDSSAIEYEFPKNETGDGLIARFANGIKLVLNAQGWTVTPESMWRGPCGVRLEGSEGWVAVADGYSVPDVSSPALLRDWKKLVQEYLEREQRAVGHMREFLNCVKTRKPPVANAEVTHRTMSTVHASNICVWLRRNVRFDPVKEEFINDAEANRLRSRAIREPWRL